MLHRGGETPHPAESGRKSCREAMIFEGMIFNVSDVQKGNSKENEGETERAFDCRIAEHQCRAQAKRELRLFPEAVWIGTIACQQILSSESA